MIVGNASLGVALRAYLFLSRRAISGGAVHCIIVASLARSIPSPLQIPSPNPESSIEIDRRRAERRGDMGGVAAGTRWIHHVRRLSAAKVSTDALERGQSRVIDASLTLIRERAKLKVLSLSLSPPISSSSCFAAILFLQVPLLF